MKEYNGRTFLARNGVDDIDDVWHYAYLVIEDTNGALLKFERVTTNEKIDAEIEIGNTAAFYFRRIQGWKKSVFHVVATESKVRGNNCFSLVRTMDVLKRRLVLIGILPIVSNVGVVVGAYVAFGAGKGARCPHGAGRGESSFEVVCLDYFEASFLDRWIGVYRWFLALRGLSGSDAFQLLNKIGSG